MGKLKLTSQLGQTPRVSEIERHVGEFMKQFDQKTKTSAAPALIRKSVRDGYMSGVRDALTWVKEFNEESKKDVRPE